MVSEEIELNAMLEAEGYDVLETDLGEFIIQTGGRNAEPYRRPGDPQVQRDDPRPVYRQARHGNTPTTPPR